MCRILGCYQKYLFTNDELSCYNDQGNQSSGAAMIICPITETAYMQMLSCSCPENCQEDAL